MITISDAIGRIRCTEYKAHADEPGFTEEGVEEIKVLLHYDRCFNKAYSNNTVVDAVLLSDDTKIDIEVGKRFFGDVMFDKKKRFKDGEFIIIGTVQSVEKLFSEIYLVKTKNSTYLVIM